MCLISWEDLTTEEQKQARKSYVTIREDEKYGVPENEQNEICPELVKECTFIREEDG